LPVPLPLPLPFASPSPSSIRLTPMPTGRLMDVSATHRFV
jgi:hypothetical protein